MWLEREIIERRRIEQSLRESEAQLKLAIRTAPITLFSQDAGLRYVWVFNPPPGIQPEELIGRTDEELFGAEGAALAAFKREALRLGRGARREVEVTIRGARCWYNVVVEPMRDAAGHPIGLICAAVDISSVKKTQAALAESEARYHAIVDAFDGLIYICSEDCRIEFMNAMLIKRTGRCAVGEKCHDVLHGFHTTCPWCQGERVLQGETVRCELQSPLDGRWYYVVHTPFRRADGRTSRMAVLIDITEQKEAERQRVAMAQTMQRSQHLESLARLTGQIAHHFNNQLTVILGNCAMAAADSTAGPAVRVCLEEIRKATERAARLSGEMLACSGHAFSSMRPGTLNEVVNSTRELLEVMAAPHAKLNLVLAHPAPRVRMDERMLQQVLLGLAINSVEAIGEQTGEVWVETGAVTLTEQEASQGQPVQPRPAGPYAFLRVRDTGGGLAPEIERRLFEPFNSSKGIGRGLGLAIALGIAITHRGWIDFQSRANEGCTATLYLPLEAS